MRTMNGVIKEKDGTVGWKYTTLERKDPKSNEVEISIKCIGICGSELHLYHDNHFYKPGTIIGHEFCGEITRLGKDVTSWNVGDRVISLLDKGACTTCEFCQMGMPNFCISGKAVGYEIDGGWADYFCAPANMLLPIPENVSFEEAVMIEPTNVICQALIVKEAIRPGDLVLVQGCGTIGMLSAMVSKAVGAETVIITGTNDDLSVRLPIAKKINAIDYAVNIDTENLNELLKKLSGGKGVDLIVEASGSEKAIYNMVDYVKKTGNIVVLGESKNKDLKFQWRQAVFKTCNIIFSFGEVYEAWKIAMKLISSKKLETEKLITHKLSLSEFNKGFELLEEKTGLKVLLFPNKIYSNIYEKGEKK